MKYSVVFLGPAVAAVRALADAEWDTEPELSSCPTVTSLVLFLVFIKTILRREKRDEEYNLSPDFPRGLWHPFLGMVPG